MSECDMRQATRLSKLCFIELIKVKIPEIAFLGSLLLHSRGVEHSAKSVPLFNACCFIFIISTQLTFAQDSISIALLWGRNLTYKCQGAPNIFDPLAERNRLVRLASLNLLGSIHSQSGSIQVCLLMLDPSNWQACFHSFVSCYSDHAQGVLVMVPEQKRLIYHRHGILLTSREGLYRTCDRPKVVNDDQTACA